MFFSVAKLGGSVSLSIRLGEDRGSGSRHLGALEREQVDLAAQFIVESAERIGSAAIALEAASVLREVTLVRGQIAALEDLLRNAED